MNHPIQPLALDSNGILRFKKNEIVDSILKVASKHGYDLNAIAAGGFSREDHQQFAQLIGYSLSGFGTLSYATDEVYGAAYNMYHNGMTEDQSRIESLQQEVEELKQKLKQIYELAEV